MGKALPRLTISNCAKILMDVGARRALAGTRDLEEGNAILEDCEKNEAAAKERLFALVSKPPEKTDLEILGEINSLALVIGRAQGWEPNNSIEPNVMLFRSKNTRAVRFWDIAAIAYEHMTGTEVADAVNAYEEAHGHDPT